MRECELSIILPVYNGLQYLRKCVESLHSVKDVEYELIIIDDASTDLNVKEYLKSFPSINILYNNENQGFIRSCKLASEQAIGNYLLFLNSDTELVDPLSFRRMLDVFKNKKDIGIVGAKLLLANNTIQHAGMSFDKVQMNFVHRHYGIDRMDPRVCVSEIVESVTGACFMTSKALWEELGGWDEVYGKGYFEDTDFVLKAKEKGLKTYYCADAVLKHYQSKSFEGGPTKIHFDSNHEVFKERWVRTGKISSYPKLAACYIVFNEEDFIKASIQSIYKLASKVIIIEGSTGATKEFASKEGGSTDSTIEIINSIEDPDNKIRLVQGQWADKTEQRNAYCKFLTDMDYALIIDGDEVWHEAEVKKIEHLMFSTDNIPAFCFNFYDFWQDFGHRSRGPWEKFTGRMSLLNLNLIGGIKYDVHTMPVASDGQTISSTFAQDIYFYHYSYARPDKKILQKISYYINQGTPGYTIDKDWYDKIWMGWKTDPVTVEEKYGTHPFGGGYTEKWDRGHPAVMADNPAYKKYLAINEKRILITVKPVERLGYSNYNMIDHDVFDISEEKGTVDLLYADDILEHFSYRHTASLLFKWYDLLKPGGSIIINTPDLEKLCKGYIEKALDYGTLIQHLYALQTSEENIHLVTFDKAALESLFTEIGFRFIQFEDGNSELFLKIIAKK